jgi:hypothetical protein
MRRRGRPWLRWTRALCKFNGGKERRAETVLQGTRHDTVRAEIGYGEKVSRGRTDVLAAIDAGFDRLAESGASHPF